MRGSMFRQRGSRKRAGEARVLALLRDITSNWRHGQSGDIRKFAGATTGHKMIDRNKRPRRPGDALSRVSTVLSGMIPDFRDRPQVDTRVTEVCGANLVCRPVAYLSGKSPCQRRNGAAGLLSRKNGKPYAYAW
jgi:hypothetical protein